MSDDLEIYIPEEAQVTTVALRTIPAHLSARMGLPEPPAAGASEPQQASPSPDGVWICPALVRKRTSASSRRGSESGSPLWSMRKSFRAAGPDSPVAVPIVSSNSEAFRLLQRIVAPGQVFSAEQHRASPLPRPRGSTAHTDQDAVVIYGGRAYLSIRRPRRVRGGPGRESSSAAQSPARSCGDPDQSEILPSHVEARQPAEDCVGPREVRDETGRCQYAVITPTFTGTPDTDVPESDRMHGPMMDPPVVQLSSGTPPSARGDDTRARGDETPAGGDETPARGDETPAGGGDAVESTPKHYQEFDFDQLAQEEMIARMRAKLIESEAALKSLCG